MPKADPQRKLFWVLPDGTERWMDKNELYYWIAKRKLELFAAGSNPNPQGIHGHLLKARNALRARLEKGFIIIDGLKERGQEYVRHETLWLELLEEYELAEEQLALVAPEVVCTH